MKQGILLSLLYIYLIVSVIFHKYVNEYAIYIGLLSVATLAWLIYERFKDFKE